MKLLDQLIGELKATGLPYEVSTGTRHHKIKLAGQLVGIAPLNGRNTHRRAYLNIVSQIRRAARSESV